MRGQNRKEPPKGCFVGLEKKQKVSPEDLAVVEVARELLPPGCKLGKDKSRDRWHARDDAINFSSERSVKRWGCRCFVLVC